MYTLSMRPASAAENVDVCINFTQTSRSWELSTFSGGSTVDCPLGVELYTPLETVSISAAELAGLIGGIQDAYSTLARVVYAKYAASYDMATVRGTYNLIPPWLCSQWPVSAGDTFLDDVPVYLSDLENIYYYNGEHWCSCPFFEDSFTVEGSCYHMDVLTPSWDVTLSMPGDRFCCMISEFLGSFDCVNTEEKKFLYTLRYL